MPQPNQLYNCTFCHFKYSTIGILAVHIREVHAKGLYYCSVCEKDRPVGKRQDIYLVEKYFCINKVGVFEVHLDKVSLDRARITLNKFPCAQNPE